MRAKAFQIILASFFLLSCFASVCFAETMTSPDGQTTLHYVIPFGGSANDLKDSSNTVKMYDLGGQPVIGVSTKDATTGYWGAGYVLWGKAEPVTLSITREGNGIKVSWDAAKYSNVTIYYKVGDGTGCFVNNNADDSWNNINTATGFTSGAGYVLHALQVGAGFPEVYYKGFTTPNPPPDVFASAEAVGKFNLTLQASPTGKKLYVISLPFEPSNADIQAVIGSQVSAPGGGINSDYADYIYYLQSGGGALTSYYTVSQQWQGTLSNIEADKGYVVIIQQGHPNWNITLVGKVPNANRSVPISQGLNLLGSTFPKEVALQTVDYTGLSSFAFSGINDDVADKIYTFVEGASQTSFFNSASSKWSGLLLKLSPGLGYVYINRPTGGATWNYPKPY